MLFRGRTVGLFVMVAVVSTALVTVTVADRYLLPSDEPEKETKIQADRTQGGLTQKEFDKLNAILTLIDTKFYREVDRSELIDGAARGMLSALEDPYTVYMEQETAEHFTESIEGSFTGIGAEVTLQDGKVVVVSPMKDSPAQRAGIHPKDVLLSVNGESLEGLNLSEAVAKIRGPKGTKAKLVVQREGLSVPLQLILIRDDIDQETIYSRMMPGDVGVIEIRQFAMNSRERFEEELLALEEQGMQSLLVDVRSNPGGVLPVVASIAQLFIEKGKPIVQVEDRNGVREQTLSKGGGKPYPIGVLINKGSASASEVLAAALKESAGAVLFGETSFGKGTVQVSYDKATGDGTLIKMTIAKWLTPSGAWVNEEGVKPDLEIAQPEYFSVARISRSEVLKMDMISEDVRSLQVMLSALGYGLDRKDGYFSEETEQALMAFQRTAKLPASGEADIATVEALELQVIGLITDSANDRQMEEALQRMRARD